MVEINQIVGMANNMKTSSPVTLTVNAHATKYDLTTKRLDGYFRGNFCLEIAQ